MMNKGFKSLSSATLISCFAIALFSSPASIAQAGTDCKKKMPGLPSSGAIAKNVKKRAKNHWKTQVNALYGGSYANWDCASSKGLTCHRTAGLSYHCVAAAKPCKC